MLTPAHQWKVKHCFNMSASLRKRKMQTFKMTNVFNSIQVTRAGGNTHQQLIGSTGSLFFFLPCQACSASFSRKEKIGTAHCGSYRWVNIKSCLLVQGLTSVSELARFAFMPWWDVVYSTWDRPDT